MLIRWSVNITPNFEFCVTKPGYYTSSKNTAEQNWIMQSMLINKLKNYQLLLKQRSYTWNQNAFEIELGTWLNMVQSFKIEIDT